MDIIGKILNKVGIDGSKTYFELKDTEKKEFISNLWDELYGEIALSVVLMNNDGFHQEWELVNYLMTLKDNFIKKENYEEAQLVQDLIDITQNKLNQIKKDAHSKTE